MSDDQRPLFGRSKEETERYLRELEQAIEKRRQLVKDDPVKAREEALDLLRKAGLIEEPA